MPWHKVNPVLDAKIRNLCARPYSGHRKGCPRFGNKVDCPPKAPLIQDILDFNFPIHAVWNVFEFGKHVDKMRIDHPAWSERQCRCCLYWQQGARNKLAIEVEKFRTLNFFAPLRTVNIPEACGVNITATMASIGIHLEWPPKIHTFQVALVGQDRARETK